MNISLANNFGENLIINPTFDIGQRSLSFLGLTAPQYTLDRWHMNFDTGTKTFDIERVLDSPAWSSNPYSLKITNKAVVAQGVNTFASIKQPIEGYNIRRIRNKDFMINFNVKASIAGVYSIVLMYNSGLTRYLKSFTVNQANTWEHKSIRIRKVDEALAQLLLDNQLGLELHFVLQTGSAYSNIEDSWVNQNVFGAVNQVDFSSTLNSTFQLNDVSLHEGIQEIDFNFLQRSYDQELGLNQRYYLFKHTGRGSAFPSVSGLTYSVCLQVEFPVTMRTAPVYLTSNPYGQTSFVYSNIDPTGVTNGANIPKNISENSIIFYNNNQGYTYIYMTQIAVDSEL